MFLLLACVEAAPDAIEPIAGTITVESGESAEVAGLTAFGTFVGDQAGIVVSPNPDTECEDAVSYFAGGDSDFNADVVSASGYCNIYVRIDDFEAGETMVDDTSATISFNCAAGEGEWVYETRGGGGKAWFYSGPFWVGSPTSFSLTVSGEEEGDLTVEMEMSEYNGRFPYDEENPEADPATGEVKGGVVAEWCDGLSAGLF